MSDFPSARDFQVDDTVVGNFGGRGTVVDVDINMDQVTVQWDVEPSVVQASDLRKVKE